MSLGPLRNPEPFDGEFAGRMDSSDAAEDAQARHLPFAATLAIITLALAPRLVYLFFGSDPENAGDRMTDTYHHWQIGYLTLTVGLSHGFRLWDLKGVEYFWGLLHPALLVIAFTLTRSIDIVVPRLLSIAFGSISVALLFHLCRRYWNIHVALAVAAFAAFAPPLIFTDALGMVEPVAVALVLLGIYWWPARGFAGGLAWGLASMARTEAWALTLGLLLATGFRRLRLERRLPLIIGWLLVIGLYMKFLLDHTGNPIYPLYWEFLVEAAGRWLSPVVTPQAPAVQPLSAALFGCCALGLILSIWKRPASFVLLCYGFASTALVMALLAFTPFISTWSGWVWRARLFAFSLDFAFLLAAIGIFLGLPRLLQRGGLVVGWSLTLVCLFASQLTWLPIQSAYRQTISTWREDLANGQQLAALYRQPDHSWGVLNIPADQPTLTYTLVRFGGVRGDQLVGQLYDPFYALPAGYRYEDHPLTASRLMACWLTSTRTSVIVVPQSNRNYVEFFDQHSAWFTELGQIGEVGWTIEAVMAKNQLKAACNEP
jgi:hypothetical protein